MDVVLITVEKETSESATVKQGIQVVDSGDDGAATANSHEDQDGPETIKMEE